jgi:hypothetical protein
VKVEEQRDMAGSGPGADRGGAPRASSSSPVKVEEKCDVAGVGPGASRGGAPRAAVDGALAPTVHVTGPVVKEKVKGSTTTAYASLHKRKRPQQAFPTMQLRPLLLHKLSLVNTLYSLPNTSKLRYTNLDRGYAPYQTPPIATTAINAG